MRFFFPFFSPYQYSTTGLALLLRLDARTSFHFLLLHCRRRSQSVGIFCVAFFFPRSMAAQALDLAALGFVFFFSSLSVSL
jgi:hypothetical protein